MNLKKILSIVVLLFGMSVFAQNSVTEISKKDALHYITTSINYPITGIYTFKGTEPVVELNADGTGFYQLHDQLKRGITWGFECSETGEPKFIKGYNSLEYTLFYKYNIVETDEDLDWKSVEFSIHLNSKKMFIQGERVKSFTSSEEK